jgi:hypothetical protein
MTGALPDPPISLAGPPRAFYDELRAMLAETGFLVPGRLALWRPKRTTTERVSFA